ncbi:MAG: sulfatase [Halobacteriaceae archaeon]
MPDRPNVLFVLADQWRGSALGCAGDPNVRTPTIDGLADEGVLCERAYTPDPVCTPARASILTGQYPHEHGVVFNNLRLPGDATTLAECLREVGYHTGYVGKWHLDGEGAPGYVPPERRQGFEFWRGFNRGHRHLKGHPHMNPDGSADWEAGYQPAIQTDIAREFIADRVDADRPFFLAVSWGPPHTPFEAPEEYSDMYDPGELELRENVPADLDTPELRRDLAEYYALCTSLDDQLQRLLDALDEQGVADDTLVVFTSDHGEQLGSQGRQRKGYPFEESVHVPLVARHPGELPAGRRTDGLLSLVDLLPTLLSFADAPVPDGVHGEDRTALLRGDDGAGADALYLEGCLAFDDAWRAVRTDDDLLVVDRALGTQYLYRDHQTENLADDPAHADRERRLRKRLLDLAREYDDRRVLATDAATRMSSMESLLCEHEDLFARPVVGEKDRRDPPD